MEQLDFRYSETDTFLRCRRKHSLQYIQRLEKIPYAYATPSKADIGTWLHAGLAAFYTTRNQIAGRGALRDAVKESGYLSTKEADTAVNSLERYYTWLAASRADREIVNILSVERRMRHQLGVFHGIEVFITGAMDLVYENQDGGVVVLDHKSVEQPHRLTGTLAMNRQGLTYTWLTSLEFQRPVEIFKLNMIKRTATKADSLGVERTGVWFSPEQQASHLVSLNAIVSDMVLQYIRVRSGDDTQSYPKPSDDCTWACPFISVCPDIDADKETAQSMLQENFQQRESENDY